MGTTGFAKAATIGALALVAAFSLAPATAGQAPDEDTCRNAATAEPTVQGGCIAIHRRKGNCHACHSIVGIPSGNIAPPLTAISQRFPDKTQLRAKIEDARRFNPGSVMPPFGAHRILTPDEIDKVLEFLLTL